MTSSSPRQHRNPILVDYRGTDYRGFLFVVHDTHGLMLLHCTRKTSKPPHYQVPGGHVDEPEFLAASKICSDRSSQLELACKMGAARELYEETGLDLRSSMDRIIPASLRPEPTRTESNGKKLLVNEHKNRLFYFVSVNDQDFPSSGVMPMGSEGRHLRLKLSVEHSGFLFQPEPKEAAEMLKLHSGGKVTEALRMAMERDKTSSSPVSKPRSEPAPTTTTPAKSSGNPQPTSTAVDVPSTRRRSKRDKDGTQPRGQVVVDLFPKQEKKGMFCCFC